MFKKKTKVEEFETKCLVCIPNGSIVEVNQAAYDYIRELERSLVEKEYKIAKMYGDGFVPKED